MTERQDPELVAIGSVLRALAGLDRVAQRRVLSYVSEKLNADFSFDSAALMSNITESMKAINMAAAKLNSNSNGNAAVSGAELVSVIVSAYESAAS